MRRGDVIARIADLRTFRVDATVSDVHAKNLATGMPVMLRVNEEDTLEGAVSTILPKIENGIMTFRVTLADKSHKLLRPQPARRRTRCHRPPPARAAAAQGPVQRR